MNPDKTAKKELEAGRAKKKRRGKPWKNWLDQMAENVRRRGKTVGEMKMLVGGRGDWRRWMREEPDS